MLLVRVIWHCLCVLRPKVPLVLERGTIRHIHCVEDVVKSHIMYRKRNVPAVATPVQEREDVSWLGVWSPCICSVTSIM